MLLPQSVCCSENVIDVCGSEGDIIACGSDSVPLVNGPADVTIGWGSGVGVLQGECESLTCSMYIRQILMRYHIHTHQQKKRLSTSNN